MAKTSNQTATSQQPDDNRDSNETGIRTWFREDRAGAPWYVQWREDGKRKTQAFTTEANRDRFVVQIKKKRRQGKQEGLTQDEISEYRWLKGLIGDRDRAEISRLFLTATKESRRTLVASAVDTALAAHKQQVEEGKMAAGTRSQKKQKLTLFKTAFGTRWMEDIAADEIESWIDEMLGGEANDCTFDNWRKIIAAWWKDTGVEPNVAAQIDTRWGGVDEVTVHAPEETAKFFKWVEENEPYMAPRYALEAFAGLRFTSAFRVAKEDINFVDQGVLLPRRKIKTKRRFYIDRLPPNLWHWMALATPQTWSIETVSDYMHAKTDSFTKSEVSHPRNIFRHSFASYHVALVNVPGITARILCHKDEDMLMNHYLGVATSVAAARYFSICPRGKTVDLAAYTESLLKGFHRPHAVVQS